MLWYVQKFGHSTKSVLSKSLFWQLKNAFCIHLRVFLFLIYVFLPTPPADHMKF